jgi:outer membrane protein OmpA-like peptidoglycan-associated protein
VLFARGSDQLLTPSYEELARVLETLKEQPELRIRIKGHTDGLGDPAKNLELSNQRVEVIRNYLINNGIRKRRIEGKGMGGEEPIASNATEATRRLNRRVEFEIIDN